MLASIESRKIIICPTCKGEEKISERTREGWEFNTCKTCNGRGRLKRITKTSYEQIETKK